MTTTSVSVDGLLASVGRSGDAYKNRQTGAREQLLKVCSQLQSTLMLSKETLLTTQWSQTTHNAVLRLGVEIQLFEALATDDGAPKTSAEITSQTKPRAETNLVARMLRHLAAMGSPVLETAHDSFAPTPFGLALTQESCKDTVAFLQDDMAHVHRESIGYFAQNDFHAPPCC
jgi:hypothetical protein